MNNNYIMEKDINECELKIANCSHDPNAECLNTPGSYECRCKDGFTLQNTRCKSVVVGDSNESKWIQQEDDAASYETAGSDLMRRSNCTRYTADSASLAEVDCTFRNNCDRDARCLYDRTRATFRCECRRGYFGNGYKCYNKRTHFQRGSKVCRLTKSKVVCINFQ